MKVKEVMSNHLLSVDYNLTCVLAAKMMEKNETGSVLVQKGEEVIGIVTETDIVRKVVASGGDPATVTVETVMSFPLHRIDGEASVTEARKAMSENQIRHVVVTLEGKIVGILSARNLLEISFPGGEGEAP